MKPLHSSILAVVALAWLAPGVAFCGSSIRRPEIRQLYHSLQQPALADSAWAISDSITLTFPDLEIIFVRGQLIPLTDSAEAMTGLLFEGKAHLRFRPRYDLERQQLFRFTSDSVFECTSSQILLRFVTFKTVASSLKRSDTPDSLGFHELRLVPAKARARTRKLPARLQRALLKRKGFNLAAMLLRRRLVDPDHETLVCAFVPDQDRAFSPPLYLYTYDPGTIEQVAFFQYMPMAIGRPFYLVCSYALEDYFFDSPDSSTMRLTKYNGWVELDDNESMTADLGVDIYIAKRNLPSLYFSLAADLEVAAVTSERGDTLDFIREKEESGITVLLTEEQTAVDTLRLLFHYKGEALRHHPNGMLVVKDPVYWVPRLGYLQRALYYIIYKYPQKFRLLSIGRNVREWEERGRRLSFYKTASPAKAATFCMGRFEADTLDLGQIGLPRIEVYTSYQRSARERRRVAADMANSLYFFENSLSEYSLPFFRITEAPTTHSQGFRGLVTLSWMGFFRQLEGLSEALRSHEVAHQWFGNTLGWRSYHDQWLSEAFAEYLGALYVEWRLRDQAPIAEMLEAWKNDILNLGNIRVSLGMQRFGFTKEALRNAEGTKAGPIWMGIRLGQKANIDYYVQTYEKGAYVLHMLRWLLRDLDTGSDHRFWQMLAEFLEQHQNTEPSTADFQKIAEQYYEAPLDWFFRQWIFGNDIPTYKWRYSVERAVAGQNSEPPGLPVAKLDPDGAAGGYRVRVEVRQEKVPDDFRMPVPVRVVYADGDQVTRFVLVTSDGGTLLFPPHPAGVERVTFNADNAVLSRVSSY